MISQCCNCGKTFQIISDEVMFCTPTCEKKHDLFSVSAPVQVSFLTAEELENYRNNTKKKGLKSKPQRVIDWRWPQNRRKNG